MRPMIRVFACLFSCLAPGKESLSTVETIASISEGVYTYSVMSPYQRRPNRVEVLTPDSFDRAKRYRVLYLLPVNDGITGEWGSGIQEAKRNDIANKFDVICVAPEYDETPWFGDHPSDKTLWQETYLLRVVIPSVEKRFPVVKKKEGRLLLGFSKSGFGALAVLLRHLDFIGAAAAWDAPLTSPVILRNQEAMKLVFATDENYRKYFIPELIDKHAGSLRRGPPRITLVTNGPPPSSIGDVHDQLDRLRIPHRFQIDQKRLHDWRSGWLPIAAALLLEPAVK